jgi:FMN-dependent oxidoreductase (nitrilotriacetate monooxygenase family)
MNEPRQMVLNLFFSPAGYYDGAWRMPGVRSGELFALPYLAEIAQRAERAKMDAIFLADRLDTPNAAFFKYPTKCVVEPITTIAALAAATSRIGFIATASTSFTEPYNLARYFASLDHLSGGRTGWNIVTSFVGQENFGRTLLGHDDRYRQATEYTDLVTRLWDSWDDDAVVNDGAGGAWTDADRIHPVDFRGEFYTVKGPLNLPRPPQGRPVLVQAGTSPVGMDFAASWAEVVFTVQPDLESGQAFYHDLKRRIAEKGRDPDRVKILPGVMPIVAETQQEAEQLADELSELIDFETGFARLRANMDLPEGLDLDERIPEDLLPDPGTVQGVRSRYEVLYKLATVEGYTPRQLIKVLSSSGGHFVIVGAAEQVADRMQSWFSSGACDGFNVQPPYMMDGFRAITDDLIPILQERGLFRTEYLGTTLREHLGLERPLTRANG